MLENPWEQWGADSPSVDLGPVTWAMRRCTAAFQNLGQERGVGVDTEEPVGSLKEEAGSRWGCTDRHFLPQDALPLLHCRCSCKSKSCSFPLAPNGQMAKWPSRIPSLLPYPWGSQAAPSNHSRVPLEPKRMLDYFMVIVYSSLPSWSQAYASIFQRRAGSEGFGVWKMCVLSCPFIGSHLSKVLLATAQP